VDAFEALPKAELHVHLFGAIPVPVLLELAASHGVELPASTPEGLREWLRYRDFDHFMQAMRALRPCVKTFDDLELITYEFGRDLARQQVRYAEVMVTPMGLEVRGLTYPGFLEAMNRGRARALADFGLEMRWIFDLNRSLPEERDRRYWADYTTEVAIASRDAGVVGFGVANAEAGYPPELFAPWFDRALGAGLHSVPHAGEHAGPESVWGAVSALGAERIAHGVRAIEDPALVEHLAEHRIVLDVCPTSNVCLGVCRSLADHPLRRLHESGVPLTVNSDDPTMFGTTLNDEVRLLGSELGLDRAAVEEIVGSAFRHAFAPAAPA
jgi:aminodeoxyfutalosine deaminase